MNASAASCAATRNGSAATQTIAPPINQTATKRCSSDWPQGPESPQRPPTPLPIAPAPLGERRLAWCLAEAAVGVFAQAIAAQIKAVTATETGTGKVQVSDTEVEITRALCRRYRIINRWAEAYLRFVTPGAMKQLIASQGSAMDRVSTKFAELMVIAGLRCVYGVEVLLPNCKHQPASNNGVASDTVEQLITLCNPDTRSIAAAMAYHIAPCLSVHEIRMLSKCFCSPLGRSQLNVAAHIGAFMEPYFNNQAFLLELADWFEPVSYMP